MESISIESGIVAEGYVFFEKFVAPFVKNEDKLIAESFFYLKEHSERVAIRSKSIAEKNLLDEEEQSLAEFIGLWHDAGRFVQFKKYKSFDDASTENHAKLSVDLVENQEFFLGIPEGNRPIIVEAILHHNALRLPSDMDKQALLYCQILRDADKLDIWETCTKNLQRNGSSHLSMLSSGLEKTGQISKEVLKNIGQHKSIKKEQLKSLEDFKLFLISMVFDLNFKTSFQIISEKQYIKKIYESLPKNDMVYAAYREVKLYIENKFVI